MPYDGLVMAAITAELGSWQDARIERVFQPEAATLSLLIHHAKQGRGRLMLAASPRLPRVHLTDSKPENPLSPPMFCMLLRKHLEGGRILKIEQFGLERLLIIHIGGTDELGNQITYRLIAEIMGRHSNIVLVGPDDKVIDAIKRVPPAMSSVRIMLPGITYTYPDHQERVDTLALTDRQHLQTALESSGRNLRQSLVRCLTGISPVVATELLARTGLPDNIRPAALTEQGWDKLWLQIENLQQSIQKAVFAPSITDNDYAALELTHLDAKPWADSVNALVDQSAQEKVDDANILQAKRGLTSTVKQLVQREARKLDKQKEDLSSMQADLELRHSGELILANIHAIPAKAVSAALINYYDPDLSTVEVELDPRLGPVQNAQRYFKRYERARKGIPVVKRHLRRTARSLAYLQSLQDSLERAETTELVEEIKTEMQENGILRSPKKRSKKTAKPSAPLHFRSASGREILVGRSNLQNERIIRAAHGDDWWLHTKNIPGSHVLIKGSDEPDQLTLQMAAELAAYYSQARQGSKVPVDYTRRKHVKKPSGSPPGYVIYTEERTLLVDPVEHKQSSPN